MASTLCRPPSATRPFHVVVAVLVLAAVGGGRAHAYCRETIDSASSGPCIEAEGSKRLVWKRSCMGYVFNENFFSHMPLLTEAQIRRTFETSFQTWADVDCGDGRAPFFVEQRAGVTASDRSEFVFEAENESVMAAHTRDEWRELKHDDNALALTLIWHDRKTGTILDVDMEFNTGAGRFADCTSRSCGRDTMDLENTVTHEAGHVLGLGHSVVEESTMNDDALDGETSKRSLEADDRAGYCSLGLPEFVCENSSCSCEPPKAVQMTRVASRCAVAFPGRRNHAHAALPFALIALVLGLRVRRRFTA